jgi:YebC/PmpR family DNA-binding regulatory protein
MSGHNKWSKIKHKKAATDALRSRMFSKHSNLIAMESRRAHGDVTAPALAAVIERAKRDSMPKDNIDRAVAKGAQTGSVALEEILFEGYGPSGTALLITAVTDNNNRTNQEIKHIFSRFGYQLGAPGSAAWAFTKQGGAYVPNSPLSLAESEGEKLAEFIEALLEQAEVQEVFTTADEPEVSTSL